MHTPGPWEVSPDGQHLPDFASKPENGMLAAGLRHLGIKANALVISTVWNHHDSTECKANARLIAAAPDLLEALKALLAESNNMTAAGDMARAALAKVENA